MKIKFNLALYSLLFLGAIAFGTMTGCSKMEDDPKSEDPIASFQFQISQDNFLEVSFTNFSQNATSYSWEFGDGNTSTEKDPVHTYAAAGTYTVMLTARNDEGASAVRTTQIMVTDPDALLTFVAGSGSKRWYIQREGIAIGLGPDVARMDWWSFGGVTPLGDRPCILDDHWTFNRDGSIDFESNNTLFIDAANFGGWLDPSVPEGCHDEDEPDLFKDFSSGQDVSAFANGGDYSYELNNSNGTLTVNGAGFYIGLPVKTADGDNGIPISTKEYTIFKMGEGDVADTLGLAIVATDGSQAWNFWLVSYENPADLPDIPTALPLADFSFTKDNFTVTFDNNSKNSSSYSWDFGDGNGSNEENPVHTYAAEGNYMVTLTARDMMGNTSEKSIEVVVSAAVFSADVLSSASGKTWVLTGAGSYKVGPAPGSGEWWPGPGPGERLCQMDDEWTFFTDGTMTYDAKGQIWGEPYLGGNDMCMDESALVAPFDAFGSGTHSFSVEEAMDPNRAKITAMGKGAFIGFAKPFNGGEYNGMIELKDAVTYEVFDYASAGGVENITLVIDISGDGTAWWTISLKTK